MSLVCALVPSSIYTCCSKHCFRGFPLLPKMKMVVEAEWLKNWHWNRWLQRCWIPMEHCMPTVLWNYRHNPSATQSSWCNLRRKLNWANMPICVTNMVAEFSLGSHFGTKMAQRMVESSPVIVLWARCLSYCVTSQGLIIARGLIACALYIQKIACHVFCHRIHHVPFFSACFLFIDM